MRTLGMSIAAAALLTCGPATRADGPIDLEVLYAGNPGSDRERDFTAFLRQHFARVGTADFGKFSDEDADGYDVVILDCDAKRMQVRRDGDGYRLDLPPMPKLTPGFDRPTVLIGPMGGRVAMDLKLKLHWL